MEINWSTVFTRAIEVLVSIIVPILAVFLCRGLSKVADFFKTKAQNEKTKAFIDEIQGAVTTAVAYVSQTMVDDLKKQGKFDKNAAIEALTLAYNSAIASISTGALNYLQDTFGNVEDYLTSKIEQEVNVQKVLHNL